MCECYIILSKHTACSRGLSQVLYGQAGARHRVVHICKEGVAGALCAGLLTEHAASAAHLSQSSSSICQSIPLQCLHCELRMSAARPALMIS